ncbi:MAG: 3-hydroxyacyl-CoA dehydrogenase NAD-binding domain-containing protein [Bacteroidota bacterium]
MEGLQLQRIAVLGAGVMGQGIAVVFARSGYETQVYDVFPASLEKAEAYAKRFLMKSVERGKMSEEEREAALGRLSFTTELSEVQADLVIEAVPEKIALKHKVLQQVESQHSDQLIIASNTSTLPITRIAAPLQRPERVVGMHFFNPAPIMKLVEVISGAATSPDIATGIHQLAEELGKRPIHVKDEPGFVVNRVARQFYVESLKVLEDGVASVEGIDRLMRSSGFRMGPFELMDLIGIDTNHSVTQSMYEAFFFDEKFRPSRIQQKKVDAGHWGRKRGKGFYLYED